MFAGLMYATLLIFAIMSLTYQYVGTQEAGDLEDETPDTEGKDNLALSPDEPPPKYDIVIPEGANPYITTYM